MKDTFLRKSLIVLMSLFIEFFPSKTQFVMIFHILTFSNLFCRMSNQYFNKYVWEMFDRSASSSHLTGEAMIDRINCNFVKGYFHVK